VPLEGVDELDDGRRAKKPIEYDRAMSILKPLRNCFVELSKKKKYVVQPLITPQRNQETPDTGPLILHLDDPAVPSSVQEINAQKSDITVLKYNEEINISKIGNQHRGDIFYNANNDFFHILQKFLGQVGTQKYLHSMDIAYYKRSKQSLNKK
jgi:hypothetical protein